MELYLQIDIDRASKESSLVKNASDAEHKTREKNRINVIEIPYALQNGMHMKSASMWMEIIPLKCYLFQKAIHISFIITTDQL